MSYIENEKPLISVVIPVYNLERRGLARCVESVLAQIFSNFELIIVNDGSTDNSLKICEGFAERDGRVILINKSNGGVGTARNLGIERSSGQYIAFIDGDDYVDKDYLEHFASLLPADLVIQSVADFAYDYDFAKTQYHFQDKDYGGKFYELFSKYNLYNFGAPWARLFKAEIIKENALKFDTEIHYREDELFFLTYLRFCNSVKTTSYCGYHYIFYPNSLTSNRHGFLHDYHVATSVYHAQAELNRQKSFGGVFKKKMDDMCATSLFYSVKSLFPPPHTDGRMEIRPIYGIKMIQAFLMKENVDVSGKYRLLLFPAWFVYCVFYLKNHILKKSSRNRSISNKNKI